MALKIKNSIIVKNMKIIPLIIKNIYKINEKNTEHSIIHETETIIFKTKKWCMHNMNGINPQILIKTVVNNSNTNVLIAFYFIVMFIVTYQQMTYFYKKIKLFLYRLWNVNTVTFVNENDDYIILISALVTIKFLLMYWKWSTDH